MMTAATSTQQPGDASLRTKESHPGKAASKTKQKRHEQLCVVVLDMPIWSGMRVLSTDDMNALGAVDASKRVIRPGSKKIYDPEKLKPFAKLKMRARRLLEAHGVPFARGIAIPLAGSEKVLEELDRIQAAFRGLVDQLVVNYSRDLEDWIRRNPDYADLIRAGRLSADEAASRFGAAYMTLRIAPLRPEDEARVEAEVDRLGERLLDEVSEEGERIMLSIFGRTSCDGRCLPALRAQLLKLRGLSFLSSGIEPIADMLERVLRKTPAEGAFGGEVFAELQTAASILANRALLGEFAAGRVAFESELEMRRKALHALAEEKRRGEAAPMLFDDASLSTLSTVSTLSTLSAPAVAPALAWDEVRGGARCEAKARRASASLQEGDFSEAAEASLFACCDEALSASDRASGALPQAEEQAPDEAKEDAKAETAAGILSDLPRLPREPVPAPRQVSGSWF